MIVTEFYSTREDGVNLQRTYSDKGLRIVQNETGAVYDEAVDVESSSYTYTETDVPIEPVTEEATEVEEATDADYQASLRAMGVKV